MALAIRFASPEDAELIVHFVRELAAYERDLEAVEVTAESLRTQMLSTPPPFECLIAELDGEPAGIALFFHNYSTWRGRRGLYVEDLFVPERLRRRGVGSALFCELARIAYQRDCGRLELAVLDWNKPAIDFYRAQGATPLDEWTIFRVSGAALEGLARREV
jgi:GNAT superfamily N-acetyltransferase